MIRLWCDTCGSRKRKETFPPGEEVWYCPSCFDLEELREDLRQNMIEYHKWKDITQPEPRYIMDSVAGE